MPNVNLNVVFPQSPGQAYICNPEWGAVKVALRPPLSKVWEASERQARKILGIPATVPGRVRLGQDARAALEEARTEYDKTGKPVRFSEIAERLGITSRPKVQEIVTELERASAASFEQLSGRGRPVVITPIRQTD